jgi:spore maturation protein CgeB
VNKKVLYLGGYFQAEHSMQKSFADNGVEMLFLIDDNDYAEGIYWSDPHYHNFNKEVRLGYFLRVVSSKILFDFVREYKPDVIVHRHYMYQPLMHLNSRVIAKKLDIPFVHLEMELSANPEEYWNSKQSFTDCDLFLYAHDYETPIMKFLKESEVKMYFYPYGVSSFERSILEIEKDREIGGFGYPRIEERERCRNLNMFLEGIKKLGKKMHVYGPWKFSPWVDFSSLIIHSEYKWEEATEVMNRHKIAINFETLPNVEGAYSHKIFQTVGCGIPTLTNWKKSTIKLFEGNVNPIFIRDSEDVSRGIAYFLENESEIARIGQLGEKIIHEELDWFKRFDAIMKKEKIW